MLEYAAEIRSVLEIHGLSGHKEIPQPAGIDPATGSQRFAAPILEAVTYFMWPAKTSGNSVNLSPSLEALLQDGGRFYMAAVLGGEPWSRGDRLLDATGTPWVVRWSGRWPSHSELLLEEA